MRKVRLWLLCLLAVLLPVQQAAAAAMLCPLATAHRPAATVPVHCAAMSAAPADPRHARAHDAGKCGVCAAFGSITSLPGALPGLMPTAARGAGFPAFAAPVARYIGEARERPPRGC